MKKQYHPIPGFPGNFITQEGNLWYEPEDIRYNRYKGKDNTWYGFVKEQHTGKIKRFSLPKLLGLAFIPLPSNPQDRVRTLKVLQVDGNKDNLSLDNLKWVEPSELFFTTRQQTIDDIIRRYDIPDFERPEDGMYPNAVPCKHMEGYYYIPVTRTPVVIDKNGNLFNLVKNEFRIPVYNANGYKVTSLMWLPSRVWSVARLVAFLFCPKPNHLKDIPFEELEVNHINGIKDDNRHTNLEWVTGYENMRHAWETGLIKTEIPCLRKDEVTGEIVRYRSRQLAANENNLWHSSIPNHLEKGVGERFIYSGRYRFKDDDNLPWSQPVDAEFHLSLGRTRYYFVRDLDSEIKHAFNTVKQVCEYFGFGVNSYKAHLQRAGKYAQYRNIVRLTLKEFLKDG